MPEYPGMMRGMDSPVSEEAQMAVPPNAGGASDDMIRAGADYDYTAPNEAEQTAIGYIFGALEMLDMAGQVFTPLQPVVQQAKMGIQQLIAQFAGMQQGAVATPPDVLQQP